MVESPKSKVQDPKSLAIEMRGVTVNSFPDLSGVSAEDVNWTVAAGEFWVIGGLRGSGKGDLLALTGGLMAPTSGEYFLFGNRMPIFEGEKLSERLRIG